MATITINGTSIDVAGGGVFDIGSKNGKIIVNGITIQSGLSGTVDLKIEGAVANVTADGSINCGNVSGHVQAGGSVHCNDVSGSINAGGSVKAVKVEGSMNAGGSIKVGS